MAVNIGSITIPIPLNYILEPIKLENRRRALDGTMLINYAVTTGDVAVTKYHFELPGITKSQRKSVRAEALKTGSFSYVDNIQTPEVFSHDGTTGVINLQRGLGSTSSSTGDIYMTLDGVAQTVTVTTATNPPPGEVFITTGGAMTFGTQSSGTNNVVVDYIPDYTVHIVSDRHELLTKTSAGAHITRYLLICEEV